MFGFVDEVRVWAEVAVAVAGGAGAVCGLVLRARAWLARWQAGRRTKCQPVFDGIWGFGSNGRFLRSRDELVRELESQIGDFSRRAQTAFVRGDAELGTAYQSDVEAVRGRLHRLGVQD